MKEPAKLLVVASYAAGMAWVESAVVFYLRTMIDRIDPYQAHPLPEIGGFGPAELVREAATLLMLLTVGILAGRNLRSRLGYAVFAFGVWDILYYVFLYVMCGWPQGWMDWDLLFLIPLPWWGPVLAPVMIASLMVAWGVLVTQFEESSPHPRLPWRSTLASFLGMGLALYVFMADSIKVADQGVETLREVLPTHFQWPLFLMAVCLMAAPVVSRISRLKASPEPAMEGKALA